MPFEDIPERNEREAARQPMPSIESSGEDTVMRHSDQDDRLAATPDGIVQDDGRAAEALEQANDRDGTLPQ